MCRRLIFPFDIFQHFSVFFYEVLVIIDSELHSLPLVSNVEAVQVELACKRLDVSLLKVLWQYFLLELDWISNGKAIVLLLMIPTH